VVVSGFSGRLEILIRRRIGEDSGAGCYRASECFRHIIPHTGEYWLPYPYLRVKGTL